MMPVVRGVISRSTCSGSRLWVPGVDVAEDRGDLLPLQGVGRGDEGEGRHDDLAFKPEGADRDLQGDGGVAHGDAVLDADVLGDPALKLLNDGAVVGEVATVEDSLEAFQEPGLIADVRPADVNKVRERRRATGDGQAVERRLVGHGGVSEVQGCNGYPRCKGV